VCDKSAVVGDQIKGTLCAVLVSTGTLLLNTNITIKIAYYYYYSIIIIIVLLLLKKEVVYFYIYAYVFLLLCMFCSVHSVFIVPTGTLRLP
jgi:hypothetical protein